jgi:hypothetical protein
LFNHALDFLEYHGYRLSSRKHDQPFRRCVVKKSTMPGRPGFAGVPQTRRVLARVLAEELANARVTGGSTSVVTEPTEAGGRRDITNLSGDNDGNEY